MRDLNKLIRDHGLYPLEGLITIDEHPHRKAWPDRQLFVKIPSNELLSNLI